MLTAAALMVAAVALFDRGPTKRALAWVAGCASAAALSRFTNFAVIVPAGAVVVAGVWRHAGGSVSRRATAVLRAGVMRRRTGRPDSAWFYLRNKHLYGDFTGAHDLLVMFHRRAHGSAESFLVSGRFWRSIHDGSGPGMPELRAASRTGTAGRSDSGGCCRCSSQRAWCALRSDGCGSAGRPDRRCVGPPTSPSVWPVSVNSPCCW